MRSGVAATALSALIGLMVGFAIVMAVLKHVKIGIAGNLIGDEGGAAFAQGLELNMTLELLDLSGIPRPRPCLLAPPLPPLHTPLHSLLT